jgi:hypothetical protein
MNETRKAIIELIEPYFAKWQTDYDITAVLKYIKEYNKYVDLTLNIQSDIIHINIYWKKRTFTDKLTDFHEYIWEIPHKPLHLYNTLEEENLLKLLLKLK